MSTIDAAEFSDEDGWTAWLARAMPPGPGLVTGIGDDAAVVAGPGAGMELVYTTDAVIEGVHVFPGTDPRRVGRKLAGRLLSDLAAMGAEPLQVLVNVVVPPGVVAADKAALLEGVGALAAAFGAGVVGGDTATGSPLALHGFAVGRVPAGTAVLRSGARPGDVVFVTGQLGGSLAGWHLDFIPRVAEGRWLREGGWARAMLDLSDGLARDVRRIGRASGVGVRIEAAALPVRAEVAGEADAGVRRALTDGEDYELLVVVPGERAADFPSAWAEFTALPCTRIGVVTGEAEGFVLVDGRGQAVRLPEGGYDHFARGGG